jgi:hypothetical protein
VERVRWSTATWPSQRQVAERVVVATLVERRHAFDKAVRVPEASTARAARRSFAAHAHGGGDDDGQRSRRTGP